MTDEQILKEYNRQKAEIERLKAMVNAELDTIHKLGDDYESELQKEQEIRAEAIKEFAERLKEKSWIGMWETVAHVDVDDIDNLVKEMVGDAE